MASDDSTVFSIKGEVNLDTGAAERELNQLERAAREAAAALALVDELGVSLKAKKAALAEAKRAATLHKKDATSAASRLSTADRQLEEAERQYKAAEQELDKAKSARRKAEKELDLRTSDSKWAKKHAEKTAAAEAKAQKDYLARQKKADNALEKLEKAKEAGAKARITKWTKDHRAAAKEATRYQGIAVKASKEAATARAAEAKSVQAQASALNKLKEAEAAVVKPQKAYQTALERRDKAAIKQQSVLAEAAPLAATHRKSANQVKELTQEVNDLSDQLKAAKAVEQEKKGTQRKAKKELDASVDKDRAASKPNKQTKKEAKAAVAAVAEVVGKEGKETSVKLESAATKEAKKLNKKQLQIRTEELRSAREQGITVEELREQRRPKTRTERIQALRTSISKRELDGADYITESPLFQARNRVREQLKEGPKASGGGVTSALTRQERTAAFVVKAQEERLKREEAAERTRAAEAKKAEADAKKRAAEQKRREAEAKRAETERVGAKSKDKSPAPTVEDEAAKLIAKRNKKQLKLKAEELLRAKDQGITVEELRERERPKTRAEKIKALRTRVAGKELDGSDVIMETPLFHTRNRVRDQLKGKSRSVSDSTGGGITSALERQDRTSDYVVKLRDERLKREAKAEKTRLAEAKKAEAEAKRKEAENKAKARERERAAKATKKQSDAGLKEKTLEMDALSAQRKVVSDLEKRADKATADGRIEDARRLRNMAERSKLEFEATRATEKANREFIKIRTKEIADARKEAITVAQLRERRRKEQEQPRTLQDHLRGFRDRFRERRQQAREGFNETGAGRAANWLTDNRFRRQPDNESAPRRRAGRGGRGLFSGGGVGGSLGNFAKGLGILGAFSGMQAAGEALRAVLSTIWQGFTAGATKAIQLSVQFNDEMRKLNSMTKLNEQDFGKLTDRLRTISTDMQLPVDPSKAAEAMRGLYAAGYEDVVEAEAVMRQSMKLGIAGFVDQAMAAELLGSVMIAYGASASEATRYSDALIASTDLGLVTMEELHQSMGRVTAAAVQVKMPFEELTGLIGAASATGLRAESAIAGLQQAIKKLLTPSKVQTKAWKEYGLEITEASLKSDGFLGTLKKIDEAVGGSQAGWQKAVGGNSQAMQFIRAIQGDFGKDRWTRVDDAINKTHASDEDGGLTGNRIEQIMQSAQKQFELFTSYVRESALGAVAVFEPVVARVLTLLNTQLKPTIDRILANIGVLFTSLGKVFGIEDQNALKNTLDGIAEGIKNFTVSLLEWVPVMRAVYTVSMMFVRVLVTLANSVRALASTLANFLKGVVTGDFSGLMDDFKGVWKGVKEDFRSTWDDMLSMGKQDWKKALNEMDSDYVTFMDKIKGHGSGAFTPEAKAAASRGNIPYIDGREAHSSELTAKNLKASQKAYDEDLEKFIKANWRKATTLSIELKGTKSVRQAATMLYEQEHGKRPVAQASPDVPMFGSSPMVSPSSNPLDYLPGGLGTGKMNQMLSKEGSMQLSRSEGLLDNLVGILVRGGTAAWERAQKIEPGAEVKAESDGFGPQGRINTADRMRQIEQGMALGEITDKEALKMYTNLLDLEKRSQAREGKENPELIFELRKKQYDLTKSIAREEEQNQKKAEDHARQMQKMYQGMHLDNLKAAGKEFEAKRKQLEYERDEKLKMEGVDRGQVETWYNSEYQAINKEEQKDREKKAKEKKDKAEKERDERNEKESTRLKLEAEIAGLGPDANILQQRLLEHEAEFAKFKDVEENKTLIAELEAKKRADIQRKYLLEMQALRESIESKTKANEVETLKMKGENTKATKLEEEQAASERFQQIRDQVEEFRKARASESDIRKYVLSEQAKMLQEAKNKEKQIEEQANRSISGTAADPRMDAKTAFEGMQAGMGFSLSTPGIGGKRSSKGNKDRSNALKKAAARVGQLADPKSALASPQPVQPTDPAASNAKQSLNNFKSGLQQAVGQGKLSQDNRNSLEITIVAPDGSRTKTAATPSKPADANVNLGRFT